jgi:acetyl esterase/lipase
MAPSRRAMLGAIALAGLGLGGCTRTARQTGVVNLSPQPTPSGARRFSYGPDASQWGELHLPAAGVRHRGTAVVIHGGFWRSEYGAELGTPLAQDLSTRGWAAWNIEYRRVGDGGGWPATLADVAAAIDHLDELAPTAGLDLRRVVAIGHSAGGQLAAWAAARAKLPAGAPGAAPRTALGGVISQAGVLDLAGAALQQVGGTAVPDLLGGLPGQVPDRYRQASPQQQLPLPVPVRCVHSRDDQNVPFAQSHNYVSAARAAGADAALIEVAGDHFTLIDPFSPAWRAALAQLALLTG